MKLSQSNKDKYFFNIGRERLNAESGKQRDVRLQQMRELTRDTRVSESSDSRLQQVREQMRDCLADESVEQRDQATTDERADEGPPG